MKRILRRPGRWAVRVILVFVVVVLLYVALLAYPTPLFAHAERFGSYRVYADEPIPADFGAVVDELRWRLEAMEHPPRRAGHRIFLCGPGKYAFFARLTRKSPESLAIGLSATNASFVSLERVRRFAAANGGALRHTRFEGNLAEVVAHEIAHFNSLDALGYRAHLGQPVWKSEGWAEYQANLAAIREDPDYDLGGRIEQLLHDGLWPDPGGLARRLWEDQLLAEYLGEMEAYRLEDLVRPEVTRPAVRERMMAWYRGRSGNPGS